MVRDPATVPSALVALTGSMDLLPLPSWLADASGNLLLLNDAWWRLTGQERTHDPGEAWRQALHPEDLAAHERWIPPAAGETAPRVREYRLRGADGVYRWHSDHVAALPAADGSVAGWLGQARDSTGQKRAESEVAEIAERLELATSGVGVGVYDDRGAGHVYWSPELLALFGLPPDLQPEEGAAFAANLIHPDDRAAWLAALAASRDPTGSGEMLSEHRVIRPDGSIVWVAQRGRILFEGEGAARRGVRALGIVQDITDRAQAEAALQQSAQSLRTLLDALPLGVWLTDAQGTIVLGNPAGARLWGEEPPAREHIGRYRGWHPESGVPVVSDEWSLVRTLRTGEAVSGEVLDIVTADGSRRTILSSTTPVVGDHGGLTGAVVVNQDITALRQVEQALAASEARLGALANADLIGIITCNAHAIVSAKDAFLRLTGYTRADVDAGGLAIDALLPADEASGYARALDTVMARGTCPPFEQTLLRKHGGRAPTLLGLALAQREPLAVAGFVLDLSAQKQLEAEREAFIAALTHDLKSPLTTMRGMAQLLLRRLERHGADPDQLYEGLRRIEAATLRSGRLVDELLDVSRLRSGRQVELQRSAVDLVALARSCIEEEQQVAPAHRFEARMAVARLEGHWDGQRLERVLTNLLGNAVKYSPADSLVRVAVEHDAEAAQAVLTVSDQGVGIPAAELPALFTSFHRGSNVAGSVPGSGLGLVSVHQIVVQHGGTVTVASVEGAGTTITVRLPL
jgi:PAS domain S-box-containing protein